MSTTEEKTLLQSKHFVAAINEEAIFWNNQVFYSKLLEI